MPVFGEARTSASLSSFLGNFHTSLLCRKMPHVDGLFRKNGKDQPLSFSFLRFHSFNFSLPGVISIGFRGQSDVHPKECSEVTLIRAPNLERNLAEWQVGLGQ
jgi:hypothetical protein